MTPTSFRVLRCLESCQPPVGSRGGSGGVGGEGRRETTKVGRSGDVGRDGGMFEETPLW